ncbi:MAG: cytochrome P450, partial [Actinocrinis sp.]
MTSIRDDLDRVAVIEREQWLGGPPHELFARLRSECPVHWSAGVSEYPQEAGYWSVTRADDI